MTARENPVDSTTTIDHHAYCLHDAVDSPENSASSLTGIQTNGIPLDASDPNSIELGSRIHCAVDYHDALDSLENFHSSPCAQCPPGRTGGSPENASGSNSNSPSTIEEPGILPDEEHGTEIAKHQIHCVNDWQD